jgi:2-oxoglutarate dehydrogenase E2 component (dihydrolipoamide succinyltransferase)
MAKVELIMPKLGESIIEATILGWNKKVGDKIELDENVLTIATDKVDTDVPSPVAGVLAEILFQEGATVGVGKAIALIETAAGAEVKSSPAVVETAVKTEGSAQVTEGKHEAPEEVAANYGDGSRFYSPLVKSIAKEEGIGLEELEKVAGSGQGGRVTKSDLLSYLENRSKQPAVKTETQTVTATNGSAGNAQTVNVQQYNLPAIDTSGNVEILEMDRMRKLIAENMVMSKHVSPHVTSFVEVDVTNLVLWREKIKKPFEVKHGEKITFTPIFIEAIAKAIADFPMINISVRGTQIIRYKDINIGMAAALPTGNLIVPVIKNADTLNIVGLTKKVNDLATRARANKLKPEDIQGGTFTITNVGTFGNVMGTPIILQPQVAIMATGAIRKKPAVLETPTGDVIAIRHMMFLSMSYDHRVVDGSLGGTFIRKVADYLEAFDMNREV